MSTPSAVVTFPHPSNTSHTHIPPQQNPFPYYHQYAGQPTSSAQPFFITPQAPFPPPPPLPSIDPAFHVPSPPPQHAPPQHPPPQPAAAAHGEDFNGELADRYTG